MKNFKSENKNSSIHSFIPTCVHTFTHLTISLHIIYHVNLIKFNQLIMRLNSLLSCRRKYEIAFLFNKHERKTISIWNTSLCVYVSVDIICYVRDESLWIFQIERRERRRIIEIVLECFPVTYIRLCVCVSRVQYNDLFRR
jgi:hypothetical protein